MAEESTASSRETAPQLDAEQHEQPEDEQAMGFITRAKFRRPRLIFSLLMLFESLNLLTDVAQAVVIGKTTYNYFYGYNIGTDSGSRYPMDSYTFGLDVVTLNSSGPAMLAFPLNWYGWPYNSRKPSDIDAQKQDFCNVHSGIISSRPVRSSTGTVCVSMYDAFTPQFLEMKPCPNPSTAVFDEHSYPFGAPDRTFKSTIYSYYRTGWQDTIKPISACEAIGSIYLGTIIVVVVEAVMVLGHSLLCLQTLLFRKGDRDQRIKAIIEFPVIGFAYMQYLSKEDFKRYAELDWELRKTLTIASILGSTRDENILNIRVKAGYPFYPSFLFDEPNRSWYYLGLVFFYPMYLPHSTEFHEAIRRSDCGVLFPLFKLFGILFSLAHFFPWAVLFFPCVLVYGNRTFTSRIFHDFPHLAMSISYMVNLHEANPITLVSSFFSATLIALYAIEVAHVCWKDRNKELSMKNLYGPLTLHGAFYLIIFQPIINFLSLPLIFSKCVVFQPSTNSPKASNDKGEEQQLVGVAL